jgi:hypothetical protein
MVVLGGPVTEAALLRSWARAECAHPERWSLLGTVVPAQVTEQLCNGSDVDERNWIALEEVMRRFRAPLLDGLRVLGPQWYSATLMVEDLACVQIIASEPFASAIPSGLIGDLAIAIENGKAIGDGGFNAFVRKISGEFDLARMRGNPILAAQTPSGPWYLIEGYTRCTAMLNAFHAGRLSGGATVPVIAGLVPQLYRWPWIRSESGGLGKS